MPFQNFANSKIWIFRFLAIEIFDNLNYRIVKISKGRQCS
jgi:hypothetical protein